MLFIENYERGHHFQRVKGRNCILHTKIGTNSPYLLPEFEVCILNTGNRKLLNSGHFIFY
jgi:hypothetical protein